MAQPGSAWIIAVQIVKLFETHIHFLGSVIPQTHSLVRNGSLPLTLKYWQVGMDPEFKKKSAFLIGRGLWELNVICHTRSNLKNLLSIFWWYNRVMTKWKPLLTVHILLIKMSFVHFWDFVRITEKLCPTWCLHDLVSKDYKWTFNENQEKVFLR